MIKTQTLKGFRDFLPQEALQRKALIERLTEQFIVYGFDPLETPALEYAETLLGKYGEEADKLLYIFEDNGKRKVGLRYDQTVPLSRVFAQYPELPIPFKRYQIQPVWRAENTQKGRFREFLQCDIDTVGVDSSLADAEIAACVLSIAKHIGLPSPLLALNDRSLFDALGLTAKEIIIIDKLDKIGRDNVQKLLFETGGDSTVQKFLHLEKAKPSARLLEIMTYLQADGFTDGVDFWFNPFLARGLDYYTSTIFELKDISYPAGSLAGGGRYDTLIGTFSGKQTPAVGVAFGFDRILDALQDNGSLSVKKTGTRVLVTVFNTDLTVKSIRIADKLRNSNISAEVYLNPLAKLEKQLKYADKKGIPYALIIGPDEAEKGVVNCKNVATHEEKKGITLEDVITLLTEVK